MSLEAFIEDSDLLVTLAFALGVAAAGAIGAALLRQSLVLGYLVAGVVIGPYTPGLTLDTASVEELADIGVVLLLFLIGVQLSLREMFSVGRVAVLGGGAQVLITIAAGYGIGQLLGFDYLESLFFGAVISNSSSTVISKVLSERGELETAYGRIGIAWSTVQDLSTIVLVVVLSTLAEGEHSELLSEVAKALGLAALYLAIVIPVGLLTLPYLFARLSRLGSTEVFVLAAAGIALGVAFLADVFGISVALGAFVGGLLVGRSDLSHEVLSQLSPLRDIFAGLFFVSVGMLIDPDLVFSEVGLVVLVLLLTVLFKGALSAGISLLFGYRGRTAVLTGAVLGQSAEFSFLLARVGTDTGAISERIFGVLLAGAGLSILSAPLVLRGATPLGRALEERLPLPPLADLPDAAPQMTHHAILCGYGRVGRVIYRSLAEQAIDVVVIEQDGNIVEELRAQGVLALQGSASNPVLLSRAGLEHARVLIVAVPDPVSARQIVGVARRANPPLDIVVRTHSQVERRQLERQGANEAVVAELEVALEMSRHALVRFGLVGQPAEMVLRKVRRASLDRR